MAEIDLPITGGKKYTEGTDSLSRADWNTQADAYEARMVTGAQGARADRPAAGKARRRYWATDEQIEYYDDGSSWSYMGPRFWVRDQPTPVSVQPNNSPDAGLWSLAVPSGSALVTLSAVVQLFAAGAYYYGLNLNVDGVTYPAPIQAVSPASGAQAVPYRASVVVPFTAGTRNLSVRYVTGASSGGVEFRYTQVQLLFGQPL